MNAPNVTLVPDINGTRMDLGWLAGRLRIADQLAAVIVPPKAERAHPPTIWNDSLASVADAMSLFDGEANTRAMAKAGSKLAEYALDHGLIIPARDQLELVYRTFKPTTDAVNQFRSGDNPSSVPPGYPYTAEDTLQTTVEEFREGGAEAIPATWVWTSTQLRGWTDGAVVQVFSVGIQLSTDKSNVREAVLVRSVIIR